MKTIAPDDLVALDTLTQGQGLRVDLVYADAAHPENVFQTALYRLGARMWAHKDMARVLVRAAQGAQARAGLVLVVKDCLRTAEAQARMADTPLVRAHPWWMEEPRLVSPPGRGGHPRGMAADVTLLDAAGRALDMGTAFDHFPVDRAVNPAARDYADISPAARANRALLQDIMTTAAAAEGLPLLPLPSEWWDFRFPADYANAFAPIRDADLPPAMRMT